MDTFENVISFFGHPLIKVELTEEQYHNAKVDAITSFKMQKALCTYDTAILNEIQDGWVDKYTRANCKEILGRIRGKFSGVVGPSGEDKTMDYKSLLLESRDEKNKLISLIS